MKSIIINKLDGKLAQRVSEDTQYIIFPPKNFTKGNLEVDLTLEKEGVNCEVLGILPLFDAQRLDISLFTRHVAKNTKCKTTIKSTVRDKASVNFTGKIRIEKGAFGTKAYLNEKVISMAGEPISISSPILEIEADDVKASHGSSFGNFDSSWVNYLCSRGFTKDEAQAILKDAFLLSLVGEIKSEDTKREVLDELELEFDRIPLSL